MPFRFTREENGVHVDFYGRFTYSDNNEATIALYSCSDIHEIKYIIWDFSNVTEMIMTEKETNVAATGDKLASSRLQYTKVVFVTQNEDIIDLCNVYIAQCKILKLNWGFHVSDILAHARSWINS